MAKVTAKALQSLSGSYGQVNEGDSFSLDENAAKELEEKGALKITGKSTEKEGDAVSHNTATEATVLQRPTVKAAPAKKPGKK